MGRLILIIGCMFSGKSTKLLEFYYKYRLKYQCILVNHPIDDRYDKNKVSTHNLTSENAVITDNLLSILDSENYQSANVILIDESQFYNDVKEFIDRAVNHDNKIVIVSGLNGDFEKKPIGQIHELISEADEIHFQKAICHYCKVPEDAIFSHRTKKSKEQVLIGTNDSYVPVCRYHYNKLKN